VAEDCEITLAGEPVTLADLKLKDRVRFRYDTQFQKILVLRDQTLSQALIDAVDPEQRELNITDATGKKHVFQVPADCEITLGGQAATLADLRNYDTIDLTWHAADSLPEVSTVLVTRRIVKEDRVAILIGMEKYDDKALARLSFPIANAQLIRRELITRYAFNPDRIETLQNPDRDQFRAVIERVLGSVNQGTQVIVYYCGHVYRTPRDKYVIALKLFQWDQRSETGIPLEWLIEEMEKCPSNKKMLLLDICHPGQGTDLSFEHSPEAVLKSLDNPPQSTSVIGNCREGERGHLLDQGKYSLFGYELARGFGGPADASRDLMITPAEMFSYLQSAFKNTAIPAGKTQTPYSSETN
jgi:hypothetical protein